MARFFSKHHDQWHVHKILGVAALVHFAYRAWLLVVRGDAFEGRVRWFLLAIHIMLHATSYIFPLPQRRNAHAPMIWPAYRSHNAVFATRNVLGAFLLIETSWLESLAARVVFVFVFMGLADLASWVHSQGDATTRGMPYPRGAKVLSITRLKSFYMQCQFHATLLSVTEPNLSFMSALPIQLASFAMTLARKHKITTLQWHLVYAAALWSVYGFMLCLNLIDSRLAFAGLLGGIAKELRQHLRLNKYVLWGLTVFVHDQGSKILPENPPQFWVRLFMFVAAARHARRLSALFFDEGVFSNTNPADLQEEVEEEEDAPQADASATKTTKLIAVNNSHHNHRNKPPTAAYHLQPAGKENANTFRKHAC